MGYLELLELASINYRKQNSSVDSVDNVMSYDSLPDVSIEQFKNRNLAVPVHSEFLKEDIWFCSNDAMARKIQNDDKYAVTYTADELMEIVSLTPNPKGLKSIHDAKKVFKRSTIRLDKINKT